MKRYLLSVAAVALMGYQAHAQKVEFTEFDLDNGLHVILHKDNSAPVVITSVMYHVGAKDENPKRTGFAHFFEHLLFEGTKNIGRGEWFKIVSQNGGQNNANTSDDRTYYYEVFPSNALETGLWMESERMLHPVIDKVGVETQNEVVKEEKRLRVDNQPYGGFMREVKKRLFKKHPYRWTTIGEMEHLDAATLDEFLAFNKKFYVPNNAVLVVAGDIDEAKTKELVKKYFKDIPKGADIERTNIKEDPITEQINGEYQDPNIQLPAIVSAWRTPSMKTRDAYVLDMISTYLSDGKSSILYKKLVDEKKTALQVGAFPVSMEHYGMYMLFAIPMGDNPASEVLADAQAEIKKVQTDLISKEDFQKLLNKMEMDFVSSNSDVTGVANSLARDYMLYGDVNLINKRLEIYRSITREEIRKVAKKYLNENQRLVLNYVPKK
ncbi:MAG: insulinase family protein [Flavobacteriales bacterium]|jgi:predicted Zn-dependent peptidase|nr:insulinase family protein [Flavobacteriales bacterium]